MKLTVIGGGGVRSMFLAKSIAQRAGELHIDELVFMDNNPEKLRIYGGLARHVARLLCLAKQPEISYPWLKNSGVKFYRLYILF